MKNNSGFTLIELSIVLVIIALIVGGVLVGKDLISAAEIRAQVSQIEKYQTAVNTFRLKYGYLPGDMPDSAALSVFGTQYGSRYGYAEEGAGDGSGLIAGWWGPGNPSPYATQGETICFWRDMAFANLVDGTFSKPYGGTWCNLMAPALKSPSYFFPDAKVGNGNSVYVYTGGTANSGVPTGKITGSDGINYFAIEIFTSLGSYGGGSASSTGLSPQQAYAIDNKADDGLPQSGKVKARYINRGLNAQGAIWAGGTAVGANPGVANSALSTNCYDNGGVASAVNTYSLALGNSLNCALSFRF